MTAKRAVPEAKSQVRMASNCKFFIRVNLSFEVGGKVQRGESPMDSSLTVLKKSYGRRPKNRWRYWGISFIFSFGFCLNGT